MNENVFDLSAYKDRKKKEKEEDQKNGGQNEKKSLPEKIAPYHTFEISKVYEFQPPVTADAFYDTDRTLQNLIGKRQFQTGKCLEYLQLTTAGPLFLFSGQLKHEQKNSTLDGITVYFGIIYNTTDPSRSHVL